MITLKELNPHNYPTTSEQDANLKTLLYRVNLIRTAYGKPMTVTSGLRSDADQARINPNAPKSKHLLGAACDISDPNRELQAWIKNNIDILENAELWCEAFESTPNWCHFQIFPPKSGNRFFKP